MKTYRIQQQTEGGSQEFQFLVMRELALPAEGESKNEIVDQDMDGDFGYVTRHIGNDRSGVKVSSSRRGNEVSVRMDFYGLKGSGKVVWSYTAGYWGPIHEQRFEIEDATDEFIETFLRLAEKHFKVRPRLDEGE